MALIHSIKPLKHNWDFLLEIGQDEIVFDVFRGLQLEVKSVDSRVPQIEEESFRVGAYPKKGGNVLVNKKGALLLLTLAEDRELLPKHELLLELKSHIGLSCSDKLRLRLGVLLCCEFSC